MLKNSLFSKISSLFLVFALVLMPFVSFAQDGSNCLSDFKSNKTIGGLFVYITCIILSSVVPLVFALAIVLFLWGVAQYMMNPSDEEKRSKGKQFMLWGIIALTVMFTFWGLVEIVGNTFDIDRTLPSLNTNG